MRNFYDIDWVLTQEEDISIKKENQEVIEVENETESEVKTEAEVIETDDSWVEENEVLIEKPKKAWKAK